MKIFVDELPLFASACPFNAYVKDFDREVEVCLLSPLRSLICISTSDCPYLKVLSVKEDVHE